MVMYTEGIGETNESENRSDEKKKSKNGTGDISDQAVAATYPGTPVQVLFVYLYIIRPSLL